MTKNLTAVIAAVGLTVCIAGGTRAGTNLVTNGGFESNGGNGQLGYNTTATDWSINGGYAFLFGPGTADTTGALSQYGQLWMWGPGTGSANGLPATSPNGGYFLGMDADFQQEPLQQTINGLTPGQNYAVSFDWAAAQQSGYDGPTAEQWQVSLGSQTQGTNTIQLPSHAFSPWTPQTFTYTATSSSEVLSFLASGSPQGPPPFALLDGVSVEAVPEASSVVSMFIVLALLGGMVIRQSRTKKSVAVKSDSTQD